MNNVFGHSAAAATLHIEMGSGEHFDIKFDSVQQFDVNHGLTDVTNWDSGYKQYTPSGVMTIKLTGHGALVTTKPPGSKAKPAATPKKPTVRASAERVRTATVKHARLTKRIHDTERTLLELKNLKDNGDVELKTAREQLLAAAS